MLYSTSRKSLAYMLQTELILKLFINDKRTTPLLYASREHRDEVLKVLIRNDVSTVNYSSTVESHKGICLATGVSYPSSYETLKVLFDTRIPVDMLSRDE